MPTVRYRVMVQPNAGRRIYDVEFPVEATTYLGMLNALASQIPGEHIRDLVEYRWVAVVQTRAVKQEVDVKAAGAVAKLLAPNGDAAVSRKMYIG